MNKKHLQPLFVTNFVILSMHDIFRAGRGSSGHYDPVALPPGSQPSLSISFSGLKPDGNGGNTAAFTTSLRQHNIVWLKMLTIFADEYSENTENVFTPLISSESQKGTKEATMPQSAVKTPSTCGNSGVCKWGRGLSPEWKKMVLSSLCEERI